jgi:nitrite reductase/ring-hydroxylating ferredoxin subunit
MTGKYFYLSKRYHFLSEFSSMIFRKSTRLTRRQAITTIGWLSLLPLAGLWVSAVDRKLDQEGGDKMRINLDDIPEGVSYHYNCMISRKNMMFLIFSTKCTHLGCRLKMTGDQKLTCPCHGSSFDPENGKPLKGPAVRPLEQLNFKQEGDYLEIQIR